MMMVGSGVVRRARSLDPGLGEITVTGCTTSLIVAFLEGAGASAIMLAQKATGCRNASRTALKLVLNSLARFRYVSLGVVSVIALMARRLATSERVIM